MGAEIRAQGAREVAEKAAGEADRAEAEAWVDPAVPGFIKPQSRVLNYLSVKNVSSTLPFSPIKQRNVRRVSFLPFSR